MASKKTAPDAAATDAKSTEKSTEQSTEKSEKELSDNLSITEHQVKIGGKTLKYTATTGTLRHSRRRRESQSDDLLCGLYQKGCG